MNFAGFWLRFLARSIDFIVFIIGAVSLSWIFWVALSNHIDYEDLVLGLTLLLLLASTAYQALFISSRYMATPGKLLVGIVVTDLNGRKLDFGAAFWRAFLYEFMINAPSPWIIFSIPFISVHMDTAVINITFYLIYSTWVLSIILMQVFTVRRQTLYDLVSHTVVLKRGVEGVEYANSKIELKEMGVDISPNYVLFGFDSSGYIIRYTFPKSAPNLVSQGVLLGRDESKCDFVLGDKSVSRMHARLTSHSGDLYLEDLGSTNQTKVNGSVIASGIASKIRHGDVIHFGDVELTFNC